MVALLQMRMKVMKPTRYRLKISPCTGHRPPDSRTTPYPVSSPANVSVSWIRNSHIINFGQRMPNGERPPPQSEARTCSCVAASADTVSPPERAAPLPDEEQPEHVEPEHTHEVPVDRGRGDDPGGIRLPARPPGRVGQHRDTGGHVHPVGPGQEIEEGAVRTDGHGHPGG